MTVDAAQVLIAVGAGEFDAERGVGAGAHSPRRPEDRDGRGGWGRGMARRPIPFRG